MNLFITTFLLLMGFAFGYLVCALRLAQFKKRLRDVVENDRHWNDDCGWDVPTISIIAAIDKEH